MNVVGDQCISNIQYKHDCKCDIALIQQFNKQEMNTDILDTMWSNSVPVTK